MGATQILIIPCFLITMLTMISPIGKIKKTSLPSPVQKQKRKVPEGKA